MKDITVKVKNIPSKCMIGVCRFCVSEDKKVRCLLFNRLMTWDDERACKPCRDAQLGVSKKGKKS